MKTQNYRNFQSDIICQNSEFIKVTQFDKDTEFDKVTKFRKVTNL